MDHETQVHIGILHFKVFISSHVVGCTAVVGTCNRVLKDHSTGLIITVWLHYTDLTLSYKGAQEAARAQI